jgi:hypothetical protein
MSSIEVAISLNDDLGREKRCVAVKKVGSGADFSGVTMRAHLWAADCVGDPNESLARVLVEHWISLPPGHFYGTVVHMYSDKFPQLLNRGRYILEGRYIPPAFSTSFCWKGVSLDPEKTKELPYKNCSGQVETNSVSIRVGPPHR